MGVNDGRWEVMTEDVSQWRKMGANDGRWESMAEDGSQ